MRSGLWQLVETFVEQDLKDRAKAVAVGIVYLALAYSAATFAMGSGKSSGQQNAGLSAEMMQSGWGKAVLVVVALVLIGVGGYHVYKGATKGFLDELTVHGNRAVTWTGIVGYVAKGLVLVGVGILVAVATFTSDPSKATGVDGAVKTLGGAPFGKFPAHPRRDRTGGVRRLRVHSRTLRKDVTAQPHSRVRRIAPSPSAVTG